MSRGHTLLELMIATTVLGSFFALLTPIGAQLHRSDRLAADYAEDLTGCRRALQVLEGDLRQASAVETRGEVLRIHLPDQRIDYHLEAGTLTRTAGGRTGVVARRIGTLRATQTGRLVALSVAIQPRAAEPGHEAKVHTTVYLRNGGRR